MEPGYRELPHTADLALEAWGPSLGELFVQAARGMFSLAVALEAQPAVTAERTISLSAPDAEALLVDWLNELLSLADEQGEAYLGFDVEIPAPGELRARARATADYAPRIAVKAATFHNLAIAHDERGYRTVVVFDV